MALTFHTAAAVNDAADLAGPPQRFHAVVDALGVPVGTVRSRIHRARRQLTAHLGGDR